MLKDFGQVGQVLVERLIVRADEGHLILILFPKSSTGGHPENPPTLLVVTPAGRFPHHCSRSGPKAPSLN